jgi:hypothetical protein
MRFRAKISQELLPILYNLTVNLEKICELTVILIDEDYFRVTAIGENQESPRCYAELQSSELFFEYKIESQSANTIVFEIGLAQLTKALASGKLATHGQLKLVKRDAKSCLSFETKAHESVLAVDIVHDIPIRLLRTADMIYHQPPVVPSPTVALELPKSKLMKTIIDKMMKFSKFVEIAANQSRGLIFRIDHSSAVIQTYYNNLQPRFVGELTFENSRNNHVTIRINLKSLSSILSLNNVIFDSASICKF